MITLPTFYHPSTVVWVDDDTIFLEAASQVFESEQLKLFDNSINCLHFFDSYIPPLKISLLRGAVEDDRYELIDHSPVDLNVTELHQIHYTPERSQEISVIIVDYQMPRMNGIDLCEKLQYQPAKKILLTGEASQADAIEAFNKNIIDRFIRKDSPTLVKDIKDYVTELSQQYFCARTKALLSHLEADYKLPLSDRIFTHFFQELCNKNSIKEYYLIDKNGSFLLVNDKNQFSYFIIHTERTLNTFTELNDEIYDAKPFLKAIEQRKKIPFFGIGKESSQFEISDWIQHFHTPQIFHGREKYYYLHSS